MKKSIKRINWTRIIAYILCYSIYILFAISILIAFLTFMTLPEILFGVSGC